MARLTVIGDCLLDRDVEGTVTRVTPDAPAPVLEEDAARARPGGAGLAATLGAMDGHEVTLVTALADDDGGRELARLLERAGVAVVDLGLAGPTCEKVRLRAGATSIARIDRGGRTGADDVGAWSTDADDAVRAADAVLVSCYGRGVAARDDVRAAVGRAAADRPTVWDPHPRGRPPQRGVTVATPNADETARLQPDVPGDGLEAASERARRLAVAWGGGVAVTLGARGALYTTGDGLPLVVPATAVEHADPCGAGDRFAASMVAALAEGLVPSQALASAVHAASCFVAQGGAGSLRLEPDRTVVIPDVDEDPYAFAGRIRRNGGTVVATGGCFDLVHAGHVQLLNAARSLGDCLIVCLNSDASVRRLKGDGRPIVGQEDRAALLTALEPVDGVVVFDEETPVGVLDRLRPHVFVKGGDYGAVRIPEQDVLAAWGGQALTVPYLEGRSTSRILEEVLQHGQ